MEIECEFSYKHHNGYCCNKYTCIVKSSSIISRCAVKSFKGRHFGSESNLNVTMVCFESTTVHYIPTGLVEIFPKLEGLVISDCGLKEISSKDLIGLETLKSLILPRNHLTSLPSDLFAKMKDLKVIDLSENRLEYLSSRVFQPFDDELNPLNCLDLQYNLKIDAVYESGNGRSEKCPNDLMKIIDLSCLPPSDVATVRTLRSANLAYANMLKFGKYSDFTIIAETKHFRVHKSILAAQSFVFAVIFMIKEDLTAANELEIEGFTASGVEDFLYCLYTGELQHVKNAVEVFGLASKYNLPEIRLFCEELTIANLSASSALRACSLGNLYKSPKMVEKAFEMFEQAHPGIEFPETLKTQPNQLQKVIEMEKDFEDNLAKLLQEMTPAETNREIRVMR